MKNKKRNLPKPKILLNTLLIKNKTRLAGERSGVKIKITIASPMQSIRLQSTKLEIKIKKEKLKRQQLKSSKLKHTGDCRSSAVAGRISSIPQNNVSISRMTRYVQMKRCLSNTNV